MRTKTELRKKLLEARLSISPEQMVKLQDLIIIQFQKLDLPFLHLIHAYVPLSNRNEPNPDPLVRSLKFSNPGLKVAAPKMATDQLLVHLEVNDDTRWIENRWGIAEPISGQEIVAAEVDLVFVPLLGFDLKGNRIGYGKGYYDTFLKECKPDVIKIGLSILPPIYESFPVDSWDQPLDYCITPQRIYAFT